VQTVTRVRKLAVIGALAALALLAVAAGAQPSPTPGCPAGCAFGLSMLFDQLAALRDRVAVLEADREKPPSTGRAEAVLIIEHAKETQ
jgi:hypothetical protein